MGTFGNTSTSYTQYNNASANQKRTYRFRATESGSVSAIWWHSSCDAGGNGVWKAVIYADNNGEPGNLLTNGTSDEVTTTAGSSKAFREAAWSGSQPTVVAGTYYHLGTITSNGYMNYGVTSGTVGYGSYNADTYSNGASSPFGAHSHLNPPKLLIYAVVGTAPGTPNAPTCTYPSGGITIARAQAQTFTWDVGSDSQAAYTLRYKLASSTNWTTLSEVVSPVAQCSIAGGTFASGDWEWQVKIKNQLGLEGPYSTSGLFTAGDAAGAPIIIAPTDGSSVTAAPATISWSTPYQDVAELRVLGDDSGSPDTNNVLVEAWQITDPTVREDYLEVDWTQGWQHWQVRVEYLGTWGPWGSVRVNLAMLKPMQPVIAGFVVDDSEGCIQITATEPTPTGSEPEVLYEDIYRRRADGLDSAIRVGTSNPPETAFLDYTAASGVTYEYMVRAVSVTGTFEDSTWDA